MHRNRGNILFLILLAVVLFAALSYAVTNSLRGGGKDAGDEKTVSQAADMMNYFVQLDTAVQRMMLTGNIQDYQLNFYYQTGNNYIQSGYDNTNCTENKCRVFHPDGGSVAGRKTTPWMRNPSDTAYTQARIWYAQVPGAGSSAPDILFAIQQVKTPLCKAINKKVLGIDDIIYSINDITIGSPVYQGSPPPIGPISNNLMLPVTHTIGQTGTFCSCRSATQSDCEASDSMPVVYHVLVAR